jgi:hypothetical protein
MDSPEEGSPAKRQKIGTAYAPLELGTDDEDDEGETKPQTQKDSSGTTSKTGESSDDEIEATHPQREKLVEQPDYFAEMLAGQDSGSNPPAVPTVSTGTNDSGSYASQMEAELAEARKIIEQQRSHILELEGWSDMVAGFGS